MRTKALSTFTSRLRHLSRLFKADLKITIFEYLRLYRILMASIEMHNPKRTVTEIALDCGYESLSSFYRDFNLIFAVTPKFFRANIPGGGSLDREISQPAKIP